jgi:D-psicose/D-tagatose/L-ribulose 3-epimerase
MIREEDDFPRAVETAGSLLGYVHACENQRGIRAPPPVPWVPFFKALRKVGYDGCITIESFDPDIESVAKLCCIWRKLADSPEQLATEGVKFLKSAYQQVQAA